MAWYPEAVRKNIPPGDNDPSIKGNQRIAVLHVDAGDADTLFEFFRDRSGGVESHFFVTKRPDPNRPGFSVVEQYRDTDFQADANLDANDFSVSIETQGLGAGQWTDEQLAAIKALLVWLHKTHGIPLIRCTAWDGRGVGYHTMFGAPSHWTPVAKTCPGPDRIKQYDNVIVPWMRAGAPLEEDEMAEWEKTEITDDGKTAKQVLARLDRFMDNEAEARAADAQFREQVAHAFADLEAEASDDATRQQLQRVKERVIAKIAEGAV